MDIQQLEKIINNNISRDLEKWERDIREMLSAKIREVNLSHAFNMDNIIKNIKTTALSDSAINEYYKIRKENKMKEIEAKLLELNWLFSNN